MEEGCVLISRRGSSSSGVGGHTSLEEGCILIARRGSTSSGVGDHILLPEDQGGVCFDLEEGSSSSEIGGDTLVGRGMHLISRGPLLNGILWVWHIFAHAQIR